MSSKDIVMAAAGSAGGAKEYVEDVFSTYLYTGTGSTQTITNGIDLAGKGGLIWLKNRNNIDGFPFGSHALFDSARGVGAVDRVLRTDTTDGNSTVSSITSFDSSGFTLGGANPSVGNYSGDTYASFTFRKAPKFFDVVTYTGNNTSNRSITHNLGSSPGMIIVKATSVSDNWAVWHRYNNNKFGILNLTNSFFDDNGTTFGGSSFPPTSSVFYVNSALNQNGVTYVAYLFAHDAGGFGATGTDNIISCGSFTTDGSGNATVNLGYEPQFVIIKASSNGGSWLMMDVMRGMPVSGITSILQANLANAEEGLIRLFPTATGFQISNSGITEPNYTYIYMAIRRPMKTPTTGTEVFSPVTYTGNNSSPQTVTAGFPIDLSIMSHRSVNLFGHSFYDRLRQGRNLESNNTNAENSHTYNLASNTGINLTGVNSNFQTTPMVMQAFRRAPGFFDVVCYTGNGDSSRSISHNLGVQPELCIIKRRNTTADWAVTALSSNINLLLNSTAADQASGTWQNGVSNLAGSTATDLVLNTYTTGNNVNASGSTYVAYLFATLAGVSKVGSYTGNGSNQTINCGFSAGARFVLIKRTDAAGDWCVFDTARGIVSGNDPFLQLNSTAAEVTNEDAVDPVSSGFIVNQTTEALNTSGGNYIYLAIA